MSRIFISYRREDSAPWAGRLCDLLGKTFGEDKVFMDVEDIQAGADFAEAIGKTVGQCDVLVAMIGPHWLEMLQSRSGEKDFVREEIAAALSRRITVVPALVGGASMPAEQQLPPELAALARRQAIQLRDAEFRQKTDDLIRAIRRKSAGDRSSRKMVWTLVAIGILIAVVGSAALLFNARRRASIDGTWIARMQRPGGRPYTVRLEFHTERRTLTGKVEYPTGSAEIQGGTFQNNRFAFHTEHVPQFEERSAKLLVSGELRGRVVDLAITSQDAITARGTARKAE
jgi:hypothetical protein